MNRQALQSRFSEWLERAKHIAMKKAWFLSGLLLAGCVQLPEPSSPRMKDGDAAFSRLADEYISGYLAWRPQTGTSLGFHEYDGKLTDFNRPSLDAELARLKSFDNDWPRSTQTTSARRHSTTTASFAAPSSVRYSGSSRCKSTH